MLSFGIFSYFDISEIADYELVLVDTGTPVKDISLVFWYESHPVFL